MKRKSHMQTEAHVKALLPYVSVLPARTANTARVGYESVPGAQQPLEPLETVLGTQNVSRSNGRRTGYSFLFYFIESFYLHILLHICVMPDMSPRRVVVGWAASNTNSTATTTTGTVAVVYSFLTSCLRLKLFAMISLVAIAFRSFGGCL